MCFTIGMYSQHVKWNVTNAAVWALCKNVSIKESGRVIWYRKFRHRRWQPGDISWWSDSSKEPWEAKITINNKLVKFKLGSGADVSVIPWGIYNAIPKKTQLKKTNKKLYGPCHYQLVCRGKFIATLHYDEKSYEEEIYVIEDLERPLLGRQACKALCIFEKVAEIRSASDKQ